MPIYSLRCPGGHQTEVVQPFAAALPPCPACGADTVKVPAGFGVGGRASLPPRAEAMPQTWRGTYGGNREYVTGLQRTAEARQLLEDRHPELAGDRRPILAHEGRYENAPLRAGDPLPTRGATSAGGHAVGDSHGHAHPQPPAASTGIG